MMDRQDDHRGTNPDAFGNRRGKGQGHDGVKASALVDGIFSDPEVPEAQLLCAVGHGRYCGQGQWIRRAVRQRHAEGGFVSQCHGFNLVG
jgi:hypothetical protein